MPGFSGTHGNTGEQNKTQLHLESHFHLREATLTGFMWWCLYVYVCVFFPSSHHDASSNSWWNPLVLFLRWYRRGCVCVQHIIKWEKTSSKRGRQIICVYKRARETDQARLGAVWVRGEAWATADKLVNEQTWRPPCGTVTSSIPHPPLILCRHAGFYCTPDPSPLIWLKLYINRTAPVPTSPRFHAYTHRACQSNVPYNFTYTTLAHHSPPCIWV